MSEQNNKITLYPSNWLYNAGVLGFIRILERCENIVISEIFNNDGTINHEIIEAIKDVFKKEGHELPIVLKHLSMWHWYFIKLGFEKNYLSIKDLVEKSIRKAEDSSKRQQVKKQLQIKNIKYENEICDFSYFNQSINSIFTQAFGKKATIDLATASARLIDKINIKRKEYIYKRTIGSLFAKDGLYQNKFNPNYFSDVNKFINAFNLDKILEYGESDKQCSFCNSRNFNVLPIKSTDMNILFPSFSQFPNSFWNNKQSQSLHICSLCDFFIMHHHLAFIELHDNSEIFINAPSFKVMYELNKFAKGVYENKTSIEAKTKREILATSVIEYTNKIKTSLGIWTGMNIEIVTKKNDVIEYFSLPYEVVKILTDRQIASLLSDLGEYNFFNAILNKRYTYLIDTAQKLLRITMKDKLNKSDKDLINNLLFLPKNRNYPKQAVNKVLKLYSLIENKIKRG